MASTVFDFVWKIFLRNSAFPLKHEFFLLISLKNLVWQNAYLYYYQGFFFLFFIFLRVYYQGICIRQKVCTDQPSEIPIWQNATGGYNTPDQIMETRYYDQGIKVRKVCIDQVKKFFFLILQNTIGGCNTLDLMASQ